MPQIDPFQIPSVKSWIDQFDIADKYIAMRLIRSLKFVSFQKFEEYLHQSIGDFVKNSRNKQLIAVFPIRKANTNLFNEEKEEKPTNDSAGRIAHSLLNIQRLHPRRLEVSPRKNAMIDCKVRDIIFVDDIIGSGDRFLKFWSSLDPQIKSWIYSGLCRPWILSYAAHMSGIKNICKKLSCVSEKSFLSNLVIGKSPLLENDVLKSLILKYGKRTFKKRASIGYGSAGCPVVFQHGCPNNVPAILWARGRANPPGVVSLQSDRWNALFPERGVPPDLYPLFEADLMVENLPELLWDSGQYKLALSFLEKLAHPRKSPETLVTVTILALVCAGRSAEKIKMALMLNDAQYEMEFEKLLQFQLCDREGNTTPFGKDVLKRSKTRNEYKSIENKFGMFYPSSFMGVQREV